MDEDTVQTRTRTRDQRGRDNREWRDLARAWSDSAREDLED